MPISNLTYSVTQPLYKLTSGRQTWFSLPDAMALQVEASLENLINYASILV